MNPKTRKKYAPGEYGGPWRRESWAFRYRDADGSTRTGVIPAAHCTDDAARRAYVVAFLAREVAT